MAAGLFAPDALQGKRILITGGGTGLGRGVARHLRAAGADVVTSPAGKRWIAEGTGGVVLSTLTTWVFTGSAFVVPSAMAKSEVHAMTMSLAVEWARYGIRLNAIASGPIPTDYAWEMLNPTDKSSVGATQVDQIPAGRAGTIEELANLTTFLLSDGCEYLTGQTIAMDGGQMLAGPGTFAGLTAMSDADWVQAREQAQAASARSKAQRSV